MQWQLIYFRSGARKSKVMQPLKPPKPAPTGPNDAVAQNGKMIAKQQRCSLCHYEKFEDYRCSARLASQREDVLLNALHDFKSGARVGSGVAPWGTRFIRWMTAI